MTKVVNGIVYTDIDDLSVINEIQSNDYLIVQTSTATNIIKFENVLIGLENTTFKQTILDNQTNILTLSSNLEDTNTQNQITENKLNKFFTVGYELSGGQQGVSFDTYAYSLPINFIQSNTIDNNFRNESTTYNSIISGSNVIVLNTGVYQTNINAAFDNKTIIELYDDTNQKVLLVSNYSSTPCIQGMINLGTRTNLLIRAYANTETILGERMSFYVDELIRTPLIASFQYLSGADVKVIYPDPR